MDLNEREYALVAEGLEADNRSEAAKQADRILFQKSRLSFLRSLSDKDRKKAARILLDDEVKDKSAAYRILTKSWPSPPEGTSPRRPRGRKPQGTVNLEDEDVNRMIENIRQILRLDRSKTKKAVLISLINFIEDVQATLRGNLLLNISQSQELEKLVLKFVTTFKTSDPRIRDWLVFSAKLKLAKFHLKSQQPSGKAQYVNQWELLLKKLQTSSLKFDSHQNSETKPASKLLDRVAESFNLESRLEAPAQNSYDKAIREATLLNKWSALDRKIKRKSPRLPRQEVLIYALNFLQAKKELMANSHVAIPKENLNGLYSPRKFLVKKRKNASVQIKSEHVDLKEKLNQLISDFATHQGLHPFLNFHSIMRRTDYLPDGVDIKQGLFDIPNPDRLNI